MAKRDQDVHFLASKEEVERIHEKMDELGIRSMGAYLRKMALDGYCIRLDLQDVKALVSLLRICSNNLNQYAKRANETGSIYRADIEDTCTSAAAGPPAMPMSRQTAARSSRSAPLPTVTCGINVSLPTTPCTVYRRSSA